MIKMYRNLLIVKYNRFLCTRIVFESSVIKEHKRVCCLIYLFLMEHCLFSCVVECVEQIPEYLR